MANIMSNKMTFPSHEKCTAFMSVFGNDEILERDLSFEEGIDTIYFDTKWCVPEEFYKKVAEAGFDFEFSWWGEPGWDVSGTGYAKDGELVFKDG